MNDPKIIVRHFCECQMIFKVQFLLESFLAKTLAISSRYCATHTLSPLALASAAGASHDRIISTCGVWPRQVKELNRITI
jgi:hypothetical protein